MKIVLLKERARKILQGTLKHTKRAASAAALVPYGAVGAEAGGLQQSSRVDATVTEQLDGRFLYDFTVVNTSPSGSFFTIVDWELPLFAITDIDETTVMSPTGWDFEIVAPDQFPSIWNYDASTDPTIDPNQGGDEDLYGPNPEVFEDPPLVLHWFTNDEGEGEGFFQFGIEDGSSLGGFSFISDFSSNNAPYIASWAFAPPVTGDPPIPNNGFGTPNSPERLIAQGIPEPSTLVVAGLGSLVFYAGFGLNRRRD